MPVAHPTGADDSAQRVEQGGVHCAGDVSGARAALPVGVGASVHLERPLDRTGEHRKQQQQRLESAGGRSFRQQPLLYPEVALDAAGDVKGEARRIVRQASGSSGIDVVQLAQSGKVACEELPQPRSSPRAAGSVSGSSSNVWTMATR